MVGRLVEQQHVRPAEQHARHRHAHLPAARQRADVAVDPLVVEAEAVQHLAGLRLEGVAAQVVVLLLHLAEPRQDPVHVAGVIRVRHRVLEGLQFVVQVAHAAAPGNRLVEHRASRHLLDVLPEIADRQPLGHRDLALVGRFLSDHHPEECGLAGPVRAHEADAFARVELERRVHEQDLPAVLLADAGKGNHEDLQEYHERAGGGRKGGRQGFEKAECRIENGEASRERRQLAAGSRQRITRDPLQAASRQLPAWANP